MTTNQDRARADAWAKDEIRWVELQAEPDIRHAIYRNGKVLCSTRLANPGLMIAAQLSCTRRCPKRMQCQKCVAKLVMERLVRNGSNEIPSWGYAKSLGAAKWDRAQAK